MVCSTVQPLLDKGHNYCNYSPSYVQQIGSLSLEDSLVDRRVESARLVFNHSVPESKASWNATKAGLVICSPWRS